MTPRSSISDIFIFLRRILRQALNVCHHGYDPCIPEHFSCGILQGFFYTDRIDLSVDPPAFPEVAGIHRAVASYRNILLLMM